MRPPLVPKLAPLLLLGLLAGWMPPLAAAEAPPNVLVLYSYSRLLPANVEFAKGLRESLQGAGSAPVELYDEFLDMPRFQGPAYLETTERYLREKYASRPPAVILAAGDNALRFLLAARAELFLGVPIVHCAVESSDLAALAPLPADVVGVPVVYDFAGTIAQALAWHPRARHLVIVTGAAPKDRAWEARLRSESAALAGRVDVEFLAALPTRDLLQRLADLPAGSVVFTPGFFRDGADRNFTPRESLETIVPMTKAPVYGVFPTAMGLGIVGGRMPSFEGIGREAGRETAALLAGVAPAALTVPANLPSVLHVDWRAVRRWGIDEKAVPADAVIHFREPNLFEAYRLQVLLALGALAFQASLIALLLFERRRRLDAERTDLLRRAELAHASRLAVAGELMGSIAHEINQPLGAILANADAADLMLAAGGDRRQELAEILTDIRRDDLRASEVIRKLRALLARHEVERRPFEVHEAVREVESLLRAEARRRRVTVEVRPAALTARLVGDRIQLQQVLLNLVLNAMDAVTELPDERRVIVVAVRIGSGSVDISVHDRGPGIAAENLPKLFDSFYTTKSQGMGLGLSIARTLVEAHGGGIRVESRPDQGATFHVELPLAEPKVPSRTESR